MTRLYKKKKQPDLFTLACRQYIAAPSINTLYLIAQTLNRSKHNEMDNPRSHADDVMLVDQR